MKSKLSKLLPVILLGSTVSLFSTSALSYTLAGQVCSGQGLQALYVGVDGSVKVLGTTTPGKVQCPIQVDPISPFLQPKSVKMKVWNDSSSSQTFVCRARSTNPDSTSANDTIPAPQKSFDVAGKSAGTVWVNLPSSGGMVDYTKPHTVTCTVPAQGKIVAIETSNSMAGPSY